MMLLYIIIDQIQMDKRYKKEGIEPAYSMKERLEMYIILVLLPIVLILLSKFL